MRTRVLGALLMMAGVLAATPVILPLFEQEPDLGLKVPPPPPLPPLTLPALGRVECRRTAKVVKIQLFGDSTQAGATRSGFVDRSPARLLQGHMDFMFGPGIVVVEDRAASGTTLHQLINGQDGRNELWPRSVEADIVVVNHGINDLTHGESEETYKADLGRLRLTSATLVLETPNPIREPGIESRVQTMRAIARELRVPLADAYAAVVAVPNWSAYLSDWAHPTQALYEYIVRVSLIPVLVPLVKEMGCASQP